MQVKALADEEVFMNKIMFLINIAVPIVAFSFVMLFINGNRKDCIVLLMVVAALITRLLERSLGAYAKYVYSCIIPIGGAILIAFANDGHYVAMTHGFFMVTVMMIPYYDLKLIITNAIATVIPNCILMIFLPEGYFNLHPLIGWIFIFGVYALLVVICAMVSVRAKTLILDVEAKRHEVEHLLGQVELSVENIEKSSDNIHVALHNFEFSTHEIAESSERITYSVNEQIDKVHGSQDIFSKLRDMITTSKHRLNETIENVTAVQEKMTRALPQLVICQISLMRILNPQGPYQRAV